MFYLKTGSVLQLHIVNNLKLFIDHISLLKY